MLFLLLAPNATVHAAEPQRTYDCGENFRFSVRIDGERAVLALPDGPVTLEQERAASGARYTGRGYVFWEKADDVMLQTPLENYQGCVRAP